MAPASATRRASAHKTASKAVVTETESAASEASTQNDDDYVYIRVPRERMAPVDYGLTETVQHQVFRSAVPKNAMPNNAVPKSAVPVLHSIPVQLVAPASQQPCGDSSIISYARVSVIQPGEVLIRAWITVGGDRTAIGGPDAACRGASRGSRCFRGCRG